MKKYQYRQQNQSPFKACYAALVGAAPSRLLGAGMASFACEGTPQQPPSSISSTASAKTWLTAPPNKSALNKVWWDSDRVHNTDHRALHVSCGTAVISCNIVALCCGQTTPIAQLGRRPHLQQIYLLAQLCGAHCMHCP